MLVADLIALLERCPPDSSVEFLTIDRIVHTMRAVEVSHRHSVADTGVIFTVTRILG
jgi:hypothetical protein